MRFSGRLLAVLFAIAVYPASGFAQERGTVTGTVTDAGTQRPVAGAQITIGGTNLGTVTNAEGRFLIPNVPAGTREVRVTVIGYARGAETVTVSPAATATVNFAIAQTAIELEGLVVAATGRAQRTREIGSSVANINVAEVELAPVMNMSQLIQGRAAGVTVMQSSGTTGAGARIRIRGANSLSLSNAPLLIIDGIRVNDAEASLGFGVGGQQPSRLNDLNPDDIESIEILKGPSAAALYGTAAANGVIQVTTRRGRAGAPLFRFWSEYGRLERTAAFPDNVTRLDQFGDTCPVVFENMGWCVPGTEHRFNPLENAETTPFRTGNRRLAGASLSGGGEAATFYLSGEVQGEDGVYRHHNTLERINLQANVTGQLSPQASVGANLGYMASALELPLADNALFGIVGMGIFGDADPASVEATQGFESNPRFHSDWMTFQDLSRLTGSLNGEFRPTPWLSFNGIFGMDRIHREEVNRLPRETAYAPFGGIYSLGFIQNYGYDQSNLTGVGSATGTFNLMPELVSTTSIGTQYNRDRLHRIYAFGAGLTAGAETSLAGATSDFDASEDNITNALLGLYAQQQFAWRDRVFLNAAVRGDRSTAFGADFGWVAYPAVSGSWVISEEPFFPQTDFVSLLRLRGALGQSGLRPGATDALLFFVPAVTTVGALDQPSFIVSGIGNPELRPERVTEFEAGFEAGLVQDRVGFEATYFRRNSRDALVSVPLAPSLGATGARWENLAQVRNEGVELGLRMQPVRTRDVDINLNLSGSFLRNRLIDLGDNILGEPLDPIIIGQQRHVEGFPLGGYWQRPILSYEVEDGRVHFGDVEVGDDHEYMGSPFPTREFTLAGNAGIFGWVRVSTLFDHKGGQRLLNFNRAWRETFDANAEAAYHATPEQQAAQIALWGDGSYAGYIENASFVRWRELAVTFGLPREFAQRVGAQGLSLTFAGRNLATWTDYTGLDPEVNFAGQANFTTGEFATLPPNRYMTIRFDANF
jgi:TonB-dependent starch-binding outer membrane protein SusC